MGPPRWRFDAARLPLVVIDLGPGDPGMPPEIDSLFDVLEKLVAERKQKALLWDLTGAKPDASRNARVVAWFDEHWGETGASMVAAACVSRGAIERTGATALLWMLKPKFHTKIFISRPQAEAWLGARIREREEAWRDRHPKRPPGSR